MKLNPDERLRTVLNQIVPSIIEHPSKSFQLKQLEVQEENANELNRLCENPIADLTQFFEDAKNVIERQTKDTKRIEPIMA